MLPMLTLPRGYVPASPHTHYTLALYPSLRPTSRRGETAEPCDLLTDTHHLAWLLVWQDDGHSQKKIGHVELPTPFVELVPDYDKLVPPNYKPALAYVRHLNPPEADIDFTTQLYDLQKKDAVRSRQLALRLTSSTRAQQCIGLILLHTPLLAF